MTISPMTPLVANAAANVAINVIANAAINAVTKILSLVRISITIRRSQTTIFAGNCHCDNFATA